MNHEPLIAQHSVMQSRRFIAQQYNECKNPFGYQEFGPKRMKLNIVAILAMSVAVLVVVCLFMAVA